MCANHDHSIIACSRHLYMGVVLRAHSIHGEPRIQRNANRQVATVFYSRSEKLKYENDN